MRKVILIIVLLSGTGIAASGQPTLSAKTSPVPLNYSVKVFKGPKGWGYDILSNGKPYVHQETIPAVQGNKGFASKQKASRAAQLVLGKVRRNELPPTVSEAELRAAGAL